MRLAFFSDTHIGYGTRCRSTSAGTNTRIQDGYDGLGATVESIREHGVDAVLHGGDMFHVSHPQIADIVQVREQLLRFSHAGIPVYGISGNHDAASHRTKMSATAAINNPDRGIFFPEQPYTTWNLTTDITMHALNHLGVIHDGHAVHPRNDSIDLLLSHGVAAIPGHELFTCTDSPGEAVLDYELLTNRHWNGIFLGHYHQRGDIVGLTNPGRPAMYAGSLLRRGFADPAGPRGWTEIVLESDGSMSTINHDIPQRAQYDLPIIDASTLTGDDITDRILANIATIETAGAIVRQRLVNITAAQRRHIHTPALDPATTDALQWMLTFTPPQETPTTWTPQHPGASLLDSYTTWLPDYIAAHALPDSIAEYLHEESPRYLRDEPVAHV